VFLSASERALLFAPLPVTALADSQQHDRQGSAFVAGVGADHLCRASIGWILDGRC